MDGFEVLAPVREQGCQVPGLILSAKDGARSVFAALNASADGYRVSSRRDRCRR